MRSSVVAALFFGVALLVACKDQGPDLALGAPTTFRIAPFHDGFNIGIDLEIRVPAGYESFGFSPFERSWDRRRDIGIAVTTHPERQATWEMPCGGPRSAFGWTISVAAQTGGPEDQTTVCESRDGKELNRVWVVRLITSIDTTIQCKANAGTRLASTEERAAELAICGSLRVLGRSAWTPADWLPPGSESLKQ